MERFICNICGYIYDPERGDPKHGVKPDTMFEDIEETWVCPVCEVDKSSFSKTDEKIIKNK